jgi:hypothetical protein
MKLTAETVTPANSFEPPTHRTSDATSAGAQRPWTYVILVGSKLEWTSARILGASPIFSRHDRPPRAEKDQIKAATLPGVRVVKKLPAGASQKKKFKCFSGL